MVKKIYLKFYLICLIVTAVTTGASFLDCPCNAHQFFDFDQSTEITISDNGVNIEYRIWYGTPLIPGLAMDKNSICIRCILKNETICSNIKNYAENQCRYNFDTGYYYHFSCHGCSRPDLCESINHVPFT